MANWLGRALSFVLVVAALVWAAPAAQAQDGDVYLIVSIEPTFDTSFGEEDSGSPVVIVKIGTLTGAPTPEATHFLPEDDPSPLPLGTGFDLTTLDGNEATIFGSFQVGDLEDGTPHMVTPTETVIDPAIQHAVFQASAAGAISELGGNTTTGAIANAVAEFLPEGEGEEITAEDIAEAIFGASTPLGVTGPEGSPSCEAEGELFPHEPGPPLFNFELSFDETGEIEALDICLLVDAAVKEASVSLKKKGDVSIAIYASDALDTDDIDEATVEIGGVFATKVQFAANKATCQFSVQELFDALVLTSSTTEVTIKAFLSDGSCIESTVPIKVKS